MNRLLPAVALLATAIPFQAQANDYEYPYSGVSYGNLGIDDTCEDLRQDFQAAANNNFPGASLSCDDSPAFYRVYSGARLTPHFGFEVGYRHSEKADLGVSSNGQNVKIADASIRGIDLAALAQFPLGNRIDLFAKAGGFFWDYDFESSALGSNDASGNNFMYGAGIRFGITDNIFLRADYDIVPDLGNSEIGENDVDMVSGSLEYHF